MGAGWHPCPQTTAFGPCRARVRKPVTTVGTRFPPESRVNPPVESIAGERTGAFVAPVRSQLPAVRAVPEDGSRRFFGGDVICLTLIFGKEPEKPAVAGFIVTLVPDFSRLTGFERLRNCVA